MSKIVVVNNVTLDGVMQAPGRPDEDTRGGFQYGGWALPYNDAVMGRAMGEGMATSGALLLGRRTYEDFYAVWPNRTDNPFTQVLAQTGDAEKRLILAEYTLVCRNPSASSKVVACT